MNIHNISYTDHRFICIRCNEGWSNIVIKAFDLNIIDVLNKSEADTIIAISEVYPCISDEEFCIKQILE